MTESVSLQYINIPRFSKYIICVVTVDDITVNSDLEEKIVSYMHTYHHDKFFQVTDVSIQDILDMNVNEMVNMDHYTVMYFRNIPEKKIQMLSLEKGKFAIYMVPKSDPVMEDIVDIVFKRFIVTIGLILFVCWIISKI